MAGGIAYCTSFSLAADNALIHHSCLQLVVVRADLNGHLKALKDYFLLEKGDFFQVKKTDFYNLCFTVVLMISVLLMIALSI